MERRSFLEALAGLTSGLLLPHGPSGGGPGLEDRFGTLLPQRRLGNTGESVTMLGVGGWHIGRMNARDAQAAIEGGVRFFDSAEQYQGGRQRTASRALPVSVLITGPDDPEMLKEKSSRRAPLTGWTNRSARPSSGKWPTWTMRRSNSTRRNMLFTRCNTPAERQHGGDRRQDCYSPRPACV